MDVGILYETATSPRKQFYPGEDTSQRLSGPQTAVHLPHVCRPGECVSRLAGGPSLHKTSFLLIDGIAAGANTRGPHRFLFFFASARAATAACVCVSWHGAAVYQANRPTAASRCPANKQARGTDGETGTVGGREKRSPSRFVGASLCVLRTGWERGGRRVGDERGNRAAVR